MTEIKSPTLRYHGAKFRLAPWIIEHLPEHTCYVEPFGGAVGVLLRKKRSYSEVYNDIDGDVVNLFKVLRDPANNARLRALCALTPYSRDEFNAANEPTENSIERARRMVVRACMGFGSAAATGGQSGFRSDSKRQYATASDLWASYPDNLAAVGQRFSGVIIENRPAVDVIKAHDSEKTVFFINPPYLPETRVQRNRYYRFEMDKAEHHMLLNKILKISGMVLISGYDSELYNDMLRGWHKVKKTARISAGRGTKNRTECLWISPNSV
ncbi:MULTISPECIES: DNA adenine methylase [Serratia]|uniref:DNA adenine methylase n=1 Tax=Serratia TaxID=613 RepID=UPI00313CA3A0